VPIHDTLLAKSLFLFFHLIAPSSSQGTAFNLRVAPELRPRRPELKAASLSAYLSTSQRIWNRLHVRAARLAKCLFKHIITRHVARPEADGGARDCLWYAQVFSSLRASMLRTKPLCCQLNLYAGREAVARPAAYAAGRATSSLPDTQRRIYANEALFIQH